VSIQHSIAAKCPADTLPDALPDTPPDIVFAQPCMFYFGMGLALPK
jgi:hypothetical protein